jgi:predicted amidohydrolase
VTRLAIHQLAPVFGDVAANRARLTAAVRAAGAALSVLPELATTGYDFLDRDELARLAEPVPGPTTDALAGACRAAGANAVVGVAERCGEALYNSAALVGPGGVEGVYRKVHLFDRETQIFDPGPDPFAVLAAGGVRVGLMICFDWLFPEAARALALAGAEVIAHPANLVLPFCQAAMITRAIENGVYVATANRVGVEARAGRELVFTGGSQIVDPRGRLLAAAGAADEAMTTADVDLALARDKRITPHNDRLADRRPECYGGAVAPTVRGA